MLVLQGTLTVLTTRLLYRWRLRQLDHQFKQQDDPDQLPSELYHCRLQLEHTAQQLRIQQAQQAQRVTQAKAVQPLLQCGQQCANLLHEINSPAQCIQDNLSFLQHGHQQLSGLLNTLQQLTTTASDKRSDQQCLALLTHSLNKLDLDYLLTELQAASEQSQQALQQISQLTGAARCWLYPQHPYEASSPEEQPPQSCLLKSMLQQASTLTHCQWSSVARLTIDNPAPEQTVSANPARLLQVLVNLISNASDAIKRTHPVQKTNQIQGNIHIQVRSGPERLIIRIRDNGGGIPGSVTHRLFDPFVTSKGPGLGTGLGLAICRDIVEQEHNGTLSCHNEPGKGVTFIIELPQHKEQEA
ncbi:MAG: HAMP domain-containing histidine kinase [Marinobacterium sp.]|nr:HAMP domain-containing histidine kinase [Marinobacterium sp.]